MQLSEFTKAPRDPYLFDFWIHPVRIACPLGDFSVELYPDSGEPDTNMVTEAEALVVFLGAHAEAVVAKVFEHYRQMLDYPEWLAECAVPLDLDCTSLSDHIEVLNLTVSRVDDGDHAIYLPRIYVSPKWAQEHAIYLEVIGDYLEFCDA